MSKTLLLAVIVTAALSSSASVVAMRVADPTPAGAASAHASRKITSRTLYNRLGKTLARLRTTDGKVSDIDDAISDPNHGLEALAKKIDGVSAGQGGLSKGIGNVLYDVGGIYDGQRISQLVMRIYQCVIQNVSCP
ncbi:MAG TPA: hypothetical protein VGF21_13080 [Thermoleophilaceae bacterium]|jgi:hypothetical protein